MRHDTIFGLYVYASNYHSGQNSRLYRLLSRIEQRYRPRLSDSAWKAISKGIGPARHEWYDAREVYRRAKHAKLGQ
jgi:hypothetical protein